MTLQRTNKLALFFTFAVLANIAIAFATRTHPDSHVAAAACFDLLVTIPATYYFLVVRPGVKPLVTIIPVLLAALLRISFLLSFRMAAGFVLEAGLVAYTLYRKPRFLMTELHLIRYALFSWRDRADVPAGARAIPLPEDSWIVDLFYMLAGVSVMEAAGLHLVIARSHPKLAWILTGLSLYGAMMLVALARSIVLRPVLVSDGEVFLRFGLLRQVCVSRDNIREIRRAVAGEKGEVDFTFGADVTHIIELRKPAKVEALYARARPVHRIGIRGTTISESSSRSGS